MGSSATRGLVGATFMRSRRWALAGSAVALAVVFVVELVLDVRRS